MVKQKAKKLVDNLLAMNKTVAAAESCTAGFAAGFIAGIPGASRVLWGSFVSYMPDAKQKMLGVGKEILDQFGTISRESACAMAQGALEKSGADYAFSITGVAGPGPDSSGIPAGTVWIAVAQQGEKAQGTLYHFSGSRSRIRKKAAEKALDAVLEKIFNKRV